MSSPKVICRSLGRGIRLHLLPTDRFSTTVCRVLLQRDLGPEATATSLLAQVMEAATARLPTRRALADRLADLYGADLDLSVGRIGDRQMVGAGLEWPTAHVPRARGLLNAGLDLLGDVLADPPRQNGGLDERIVEVERLNLGRTLRTLSDDKVRHATSRAVAETCRGEPHGLDPLGRLEDLDAVTPTALAEIHARLLASAPLDVFLVGDLDARTAEQAVRTRLLGSVRRGRLRRPPPAAAVREPRGSPRRVVEQAEVAQSQVVLAWRGRIPPRSRLAPAARVLAGLLGGGAFGALYRDLRETRGLCYFADASWNLAKGYLLVHTAVDPDNETRVIRLARRIVRDVAGGRIDPAAWDALREAEHDALRGLGDDRGALLAWHQAHAVLKLGASPRRWLEALDGVTPAAIRAVGRRIAPDTTFVLGRAAGRRR